MEKTTASVQLAVDWPLKPRKALFWRLRPLARRTLSWKRSPVAGVAMADGVVVTGGVGVESSHMLNDVEVPALSDWASYR